MVSVVSNLNSYKRASCRRHCGRVETCHDPCRKRCQERRSSCQQLALGVSKSGYHLGTTCEQVAVEMQTFWQSQKRCVQRWSSHTSSTLWASIDDSLEMAFFEMASVLQMAHSKKRNGILFLSIPCLSGSVQIYWKGQWKWQDVI